MHDELDELLNSEVGCVAKVVVVALFSLARIFGGCAPHHSPPSLVLFFLFLVEIITSTLIPLFMPGSVNNGSVS